MSLTSRKLDYPYITSDPGIAGGYDVVHAQDLKRKGKTDSEQFAFAVQAERCLVTFNVWDFVHLHNQYAGENREHWGIIISRQLPIG